LVTLVVRRHLAMPAVCRRARRWGLRSFRRFNL
jgi:hypothetical protein